MYKQPGVEFSHIDCKAYFGESVLAATLMFTFLARQHDEIQLWVITESLVYLR